MDQKKKKSITVLFCTFYFDQYILLLYLYKQMIPNMVPALIVQIPQHDYILKY